MGVRDGRRPSRSVGAQSLSLAIERTCEKLRRLCEEAVAAGYKHVKLKVGADLADDVRRCGIARDVIGPGGNLMIDAYELRRPRIARTRMATELGLEPGSYGVVTLHRPSNVDDPAILRELLALLVELSDEMPLIFPIHPRTVTAARKACASRRAWSATTLA